MRDGGFVHNLSSRHSFCRGKLDFILYHNTCIQLSKHAERLTQCVQKSTDLHTHDAVLAQVLLDELVVRKRHALLVDAAETPLVDKLPDGLKIGSAEGNVG